VADLCPPTLFIPNAFSPNANGLNDHFNPVTTFVIEMHMEIYNRWGELVYSTDDLQPGWDGMYKGLPAQEDVYVYIVSARGINKRLYYRKGTFHLVR
jgi:gliding motility-associated-like protein